MAEIIVDIFNDVDNDAFRVKWRRGSLSQYPYKIRRQRILERSSEVRHALQDLVDFARNGAREKYPSGVQELARQGNNLRNALFFGISPEDRNNADRARKWVEQKVIADRDTITFSVPSRIHIPWGLICDDLGPDAAEINEIDIQAKFWCVKHNVSSHYHEIPPEGIDTAWHPSAFPVLFGADKRLWDSVIPVLDEIERQRLHSLLAHPAQPKFTLKDLYSRWRENTHGILGFYCHASGTRLLIENELTALHFEEQFARPDSSYSEPPTLVFLAGCRTAIGDLQTAFLEVTSSSGYCGFIGTEVKVPDIFTLKFLVRFLDRLFSSGETVGLIMKGLRMDHWPLSLVFSVCCAQELRLEKTGTSSGLITSKPNLSFGSVSSVPQGAVSNSNG